MAGSTHARRQEVEQQLRSLFGRSEAFQTLPPAERQAILANTTAVVQTMAENRAAQATGSRDAKPAATDPFAVGLADQAKSAQTTFTGGAQPGAEKFGPTKQGDFGTAIATGTSQAGELLRQVNFPAFVAELVQGVFQAVVDASIQQMRAYADLVQSVTMSLNEFRDANVTENQGRDHLVSKFPNLMQINVTDSGPRLGLRANADEDQLAKVGETLGLGDQAVSLDDEDSEAQLVNAARNDLARSRQSLLATMVLMGINRIVVTDGKINAKLRFNFSARDTYQQKATSYDYENFGTTKTSQSTHESSTETGESYKESRSKFLGPSRSGESSRWTQATDQYAEMPSIYLTNTTDTLTGGELSATASLQGDVNLSFKSETFDLNKLASADEIFKLQRVSSAGRGAPGAPVGTPQAAGGSSAPAPTSTPIGG
jgi:hypothetical protein